jgi:hydrogenase expression/formation protein HypC
MCLAVPGRVLAIRERDQAARVGFGGIEREASLAFLPEARVGDYVLVHAGVALTIIDEHEAARVFEYLRAIDGLAAEGV